MILTRTPLAGRTKALLIVPLAAASSVQVFPSQSHTLLTDIMFRCRYDVPLVADIHFQPKVALAVAEAFEKIRINPGNFADGRKSFEVINYDDPAQFTKEQEEIREVNFFYITGKFTFFCELEGVSFRRKSVACYKSTFLVMF